MGKRKTDEGYGEGQVQLSDDDDALIADDEFTGRLLEIFTAPGYRPPTLPKVAMELMELSQKPDVRFEEVVAVLEQDTMLAGKVLKLVRSPIYCGAVEITSLKNAVVRLGLNTLRDIVIEVSMNMRVFRSDAYTDTMERLRRHSAFTAHLCRTICKYTSIEGEFAFLCGLMHDVGIAGTLVALSEPNGKWKRPDLISVWPGIHRMHHEAGVLMAKFWDLPLDIQLVVSAHHRVKIDGQGHPMAATVALADHIAHELGLGVVPGEDETPEGVSEVEVACLTGLSSVDRTPERVLDEARELLGLNEQQMKRIYEAAEELKDTLH